MIEASVLTVKQYMVQLMKKDDNDRGLCSNSETIQGVDDDKDDNDRVLCSNSETIQGVDDYKDDNDRGLCSNSETIQGVDDDTRQR